MRLNVNKLLLIVVLLMLVLWMFFVPLGLVVSPYDLEYVLFLSGSPVHLWRHGSLVYAHFDGLSFEGRVDVLDGITAFVLTSVNYPREVGRDGWAVLKIVISSGKVGYEYRRYEMDSGVWRLVNVESGGESTILGAEREVEDTFVEPAIQVYGYLIHPARFQPVLYKNGSLTRIGVDVQISKSELGRIFASRWAVSGRLIDISDLRIAGLDLEMRVVREDLGSYEVQPVLWAADFDDTYLFSPAGLGVTWRKNGLGLRVTTGYFYSIDAEHHTNIFYASFAGDPPSDSFAEIYGTIEIKGSASAPGRHQDFDIYVPVRLLFKISE